MTAADATPLRRRAPATTRGLRTLSDRAVEYRDGAEQELAYIVAKARDLSSTSPELAAAASSWAERYSLAAARANVFRALDLDRDMVVLELGAGCGPVTRYLGEQCGVVDAVEPVESRARVAALRTRDLPAVDVYVGGIADVPAEPAYELVALIGVLEYVGAGTGDAAPYHAFLERCRSVLKPGGALVLAIENALGAKYLAGAPEDHSGRPFDSVEGYPSNFPARTFSRAELEELLAGAGFRATVLTAFPDYKLPLVLLHDDLFARELSLAWRLPYFPSPDHAGQRRLRLVDEGRLWRSLVRAGLGPACGNSFVVIATPGDAPSGLWPGGRLAAAFSTDRAPEYMTQTEVAADGDGLVFRRRRLTGAPAETATKLALDPRDEHYVAGEELVDVLASATAEEVAPLLTAWRRLAVHESEGGKAPFDAVPRNTIVTPDGALQLIDREWVTAIPFADLVHRAVLTLSLDLADRSAPERWPCETAADLADHLAGLLGVAEMGWLDASVNRESRLQAEVTRADVTVTRALLLERLARPLRNGPLGERDHDLPDRLEAVTDDRDELRWAFDRANEHAAGIQSAYDKLSAAHEAVRAQADARQRELAARIQQLEADAAGRQAQLDTVLASRSWRATAALRGLAARLRWRG